VESKLTGTAALVTGASSGIGAPRPRRPYSRPSSDSDGWTPWSITQSVFRSRGNTLSVAMVLSLGNGRSGAMDWMMMPGRPALTAFASGRRYLAAVTVLRPDRVRSEGLLNGDVLPAEPGRLITWLGSAGGWQRSTGRPAASHEDHPLSAVADARAGAK
jgi:hypothetical protein